MTGYDFHPEARFDLEEIWEFIRIDSLVAAGFVVEEILSALRALVSFPSQGHKRQDLTSRSLRFKAAVGCGDMSWKAQPARDSRDSQRKSVSCHHTRKANSAMR